MTRERLNPYLVLGIPYAAPIKEVHKGFAKRARAIRNEEFDSYLLEDLTWAKHQIEQAERDPELDLTMYRVPANSEAFKNDLSQSSARGFFNPTVKKVRFSITYSQKSLVLRYKKTSDSFRKTF